MSQPELIEIPETEFEEVYSLLADATTAAATGDTNTCASKAADAKEKVLEIHKEATADA